MHTYSHSHLDEKINYKQSLREWVNNGNERVSETRNVGGNENFVTFIKNTFNH